MPQLYYPTVIGMFFIRASEDYLEQVSIISAYSDVTDLEAQNPKSVLANSSLLQETVRQIEAYFSGQLFAFDLPLQSSKSPRGEAIRQALCRIPYGETASYRQLAMIAHSGARAIGQACARNPFALIVPCHRIIKADGSLGQYSAGEGVETKQKLINHEKRYRE